METRPFSVVWVCPLLAAAIVSSWSTFGRADEKEAVRDIDLGGVALTVPTRWKQQQPANQMRLAQFEIPAADGDDRPAELTVFQFGRGAGVQAQVDRWRGQFEADGREFAVVQGKGRVGEYVLVEGSGTFKQPDGPPILGKTTPVPNSRMLVAMFSDGKDRNLFLKLVGPDKTVSANKSAFRAAFGADSEKEKELPN